MILIQIQPARLALQVGPTPETFLGFKPSLLAGRCLTDFIDVFAELHTEVEELVGKMVHKVGQVLVAYSS